MADINVQMSQRNVENTDWNNIYPITKAANVKTSADSDVETQLAESATYPGLSFFKLLENGEVTKIKLIGDSITVGVGGGGSADATRPEIGSTGVHEANIAARVWANFFREYIAANYPTIEFFNAGIGGWGAKNEGLTYGTDWYGTNNDVCFVMLGANDRADCATEVEFETAIETFLTGVKATCNHMYVMTSISHNDFDDSGVITSGLNLTMDQINRITKHVCIKNGWKHISFYDKVLDYCNKSKSRLSDVLNTTDSHPNYSGYILMWKILQAELGIYDNVYNYRTNLVDADGVKIVSYSGGDISDLNAKLPWTYPEYTISQILVPNSYPDVADMPEGKGGILTTYRGANEYFTYQEYVIRDTGRKYLRSAISNTWSAWEIAGDFIYADATYSTLVTDFKINSKSYTIISNSHPDKAYFPMGAGGLIETTRTSNDYFSFQLYYVYPGNKIFKRTWTGSAWGNWERISGNLSLTSTERTNMSTVGLSVGDMVFDKTLNKPVWYTGSGWVDATGATV